MLFPQDQLKYGGHCLDKLYVYRRGSSVNIVTIILAMSLCGYKGWNMKLTTYLSVPIRCVPWAEAASTPCIRLQSTVPCS